MKFDSGSTTAGHTILEFVVHVSQLTSQIRVLAAICLSQSFIDN